MSFQKIRKLGKGAYGRVYLAKGDEKEYAVKVNSISKTLGNTIGCVRELHFFNFAKGHPFLLQLEDVIIGEPFSNGTISPIMMKKGKEENKSRTRDKICLILERGDFDGSQFINDKYSMEMRVLFSIHLCLAVEFLHSRGIYHRDLKPANIICFMNEGKLVSTKITDFGLSQYYCSNNASEAGYITPWYRAPEVSLNKDYDYCVDVWSVGCIMYELFSVENAPLFPHSEDHSLINAMISKVVFSMEDYNLARAIFKDKITSDYCTLQSKIPQLEIENEEIREVVRRALLIKEERATISELLNMPWTAPHSRLISQVRGSFGIDKNGRWILSPVSSLFLLNHILPSDVETKAREHIKYIIDNRYESPINKWYSHEVMFHGLEIFVRLISRYNIPEEDISLWINAILFIAVKFFMVFGADGLSLKDFNFRVKKMSPRLFAETIEYIEEKVLVDICGCEIFRYTIYELSPVVLSDKDLYELLVMALESKKLNQESISNPQKQ